MLSRGWLTHSFATDAATGPKLSITLATHWKYPIFSGGVTIPRDAPQFLETICEVLPNSQPLGTVEQEFRCRFLMIRMHQALMFQKPIIKFVRDRYVAIYSPLGSRQTGLACPQIEGV